MFPSKQGLSLIYPLNGTLIALNSNRKVEHEWPTAGTLTCMGHVQDLNPGVWEKLVPKEYKTGQPD